MPKVRDDQLPPIRLAAPLRRGLEALAEAEGRSVSDYVRRVLVDHTAQRAVDDDHRSLIERICAEVVDHAA
jgi:hypothetical protein